MNARQIVVGEGLELESWFGFTDDSVSGVFEDYGRTSVAAGGFASASDHPIRDLDHV